MVGYRPQMEDGGGGGRAGVGRCIAQSPNLTRRSSVFVSETTTSEQVSGPRVKGLMCSLTHWQAEVTGVEVPLGVDSGVNFLDCV